MTNLVFHPLPDQRQCIRKAESELLKAGVYFDTSGDGEARIWHLDWSLEGANLEQDSLYGVDYEAGVACALNNKESINMACICRDCGRSIDCDGGDYCELCECAHETIMRKMEIARDEALEEIYPSSDG